MKALTVLPTLVAMSIASLAVAAETDDPSSLKDFVVRSGETMVRVRLRAVVDGHPWREHVGLAQREQVAALFRQLDGNGDGFLSAAEAKRLPKPGALIPRLDEGDIHIAFNFRVLDADRDQKVSFQELSRYLSRFVGRPLTIASAEPPKGGSRDDLFWQLDADRDGELTRQECDAVDGLWKNDRDGNRVLASEELARTVASFTGLEFVAEPLRRADPTEGLSIEAADAPGEPDVIVEFDLSEGVWSAASTRPQVTITEDRLSNKDRCRAEVGADGATLTVNGHRVELSLVPPAFRRQQGLSRTILRQFDAAAEETEGGEAGIGRSTELPQPLKNLFDIADRSGDGRLLRSEIVECVTSYVGRQITAESTQLKLTLFPPRHDLTGLCDGNIDSQLSGRELARLPGLLFSGRSSPASVRRKGFPSVTRVVLQRGPFSTEKAGGGSLPEGGPPWFVHSDRNHDGDLDSLEFLGGSGLFEEIDLNHDGWVDLREAIAADRVFQENPPKKVMP